MDSGSGRGQAKGSSTPVSNGAPVWDPKLSNAEWVVSREELARGPNAQDARRERQHRRQYCDLLAVLGAASRM